MPKRAFKTIADTRVILQSIAKELHALGYPLSHIRQLKTKHIDALVSKWQADLNGVGTMKNKLSKLRLTAHAIGKPNIVKRENKDYGIGARPASLARNKVIDSIDISKVLDPHLKLSIRLQQLFGLRREESLKIIVGKADRGEYLVLEKSWTKGGISRRIPIINTKQRELLNEVKAFVGERRSLIPEGKSNKQQINRYIDQTRQLGFRNLHGLRYAYAQRRYRELSLQFSGKACECSFRGGKLRKNMTKAERLLDEKVRTVLSAELGHSRPSIVAIYCGK